MLDREDLPLEVLHLIKDEPAVRQVVILALAMVTLISETAADPVAGADYVADLLRTEVEKQVEGGRWARPIPVLGLLEPSTHGASRSPSSQTTAPWPPTRIRPTTIAMVLGILVTETTTTTACPMLLKEQMALTR